MKCNENIYFNKKGTPTYICHGLISAKTDQSSLGFLYWRKTRESRTGKEEETL